MRRTVMLLSLGSLLLAGCGGGAAAPGDNESEAAANATADPMAALTPRQRQGATCFAARASRFAAESPAGATLSVEQANEAAHYLLLGATENGVTEPDVSNRLRAAGQGLIDGLRGEPGRARLAQCAADFPSTVAGGFSGLPADSGETRTACYGLSFAMAQVWGNSPDVRSPRIARYLKLVETLDRRIAADAQAQGVLEPQKLLGQVKAGLATALGWGPITEVLDACTERYAE